MTLEASGDGLWEWNTHTGEVCFSSRYCTMLGYEPYELSQSYDAWSGLLHPDDRESVENALDAPIVYQDRLVGNLLIGKKKDGYTDDDKQLLETITDQIAPVLNTRLELDREQKAARWGEG